MKSTEVPIRKLLPIQRRLFLERMEPVRRGLARGRELPPIELVSYPLDGNLNYLIVDGHHRVRGHHEIGRLAVSAYLIETDGDIKHSAAAQHSLEGCTHIADVHNRYLTVWLPRLVSLRATTINALLTYSI